MGHYFVGSSHGKVTIFRGFAQEMGPIRLASVDQVTELPVAGLPQQVRDQLQGGISANSEASAKVIIDGLRKQIPICPPAAQPQPSATASTTSGTTNPNPNAIGSALASQTKAVPPTGPGTPLGVATVVPSPISPKPTTSSSPNTTPNSVATPAPQLSSPNCIARTED
jgi:protein phosphatase